jgi:hypothetical protein
VQSTRVVDLVLRFYPFIEEAARACCPHSRNFGVQLSTLFKARREWGIRTIREGSEFWYLIN